LVVFIACLIPLWNLRCSLVSMHCNLFLYPAWKICTYRHGKNETLQMFFYLKKLHLDYRQI
jgi:hypothetical protein